jgi:hypothetical protein
LHKILSLIHIKKIMCPARCNLHGNGRQANEKSDSSSFAELGSLVRMNE